MRCLLMQAAPLLSSRASVTNGWRSLPAGDAKLGKPLSHGDVTPPADDACVVETLGRAESAMSAETAYFDAGYPCNYGASSVHCLDCCYAELYRVSTSCCQNGLHKHRWMQGHCFQMSLPC